MSVVTDFSFRPAAILLEDGTVFFGRAAGVIGTTIGEICFNTGMTGYQEIFTDPSYFGQIMVTTNAHIGNYGTMDTEVESSSIKIAGLVCKNFTVPFSRLKSGSSIQSYFEQQKLVAICDVDTRAIVRHIRDKGAMNAIISSETLDLKILMERLQEAPSMDGLELASRVSTTIPYTYGRPDATFRVAALDFGIKQNILACLADRDCYVQVFPARTPFHELKAFSPNGYFLSNGPGDPASMDYAVQVTTQILAEKAPLFGICLGHQLLGLASGVQTYKMHHGHRGINHPVKNVITGHCEITSQNHGFGVSPEDIRKHADRIEVTHVNLNDHSVEGFRLKHVPAFSVQYHPESSPGPHDARYLFDQFTAMMR
jgi:carbamoyl-phosphate synthase small subunit